MNFKPWLIVAKIVVIICYMCVFHETILSVRATSCSEPNVIEADILGDKEHHRRTRRAATASDKKLWPGGVIPYVIADTFSNKTVSLIRDAMNHWQGYTCLDFVERRDEKDYVYIVSGKGCCSYVGKRGGQQRLSLGIGCDLFGIVVHELGHAIGFWHEQSRPDRDNYVKILYQNVYTKDHHNFKKLGESHVNSRHQRYDFRSIMHYGYDFFAKKSNQYTILPKLRGIKKEELGKQYLSRHRYALSGLDIIQTNLMYRCNIFNGKGGTIFAKSGRFHSANYPSPYPVSKDRVWIVTTEKSPTSSLTLIFDTFSVGSNDGTGICKDDYLDIRNGKGFLSPYLTQLCGNEQPDPITVLSESIYARLHSELPIHKSVGLKGGFSIRFKTDECSRKMTELRNSFSTPNFPKRYQAHTDCVWQINVPKGYRIKITFHTFQVRNVDNKKGCLDYVDFRDGDSPYSTFFGRFCGDNNPGVVTSTSTSYRIILHSTTPHTQASAVGFSASYETIDVDECAEKTSDCEQACFNEQGGYLCGCRAGYTFIPELYGACVDKNECEINNGGCSHGCENTDGGFYCTCPEGHYLISQGQICTDINECELHPCAHECKNYVGGFECLCNSGYELNDDERTCRDIDECKDSPCPQKCLNTDGGYKCSCNSGNILDKKTNRCKILPSCGGIFVKPSGKLRSPLVPSSLPHALECYWNIRVPRAKIVNVSLFIAWKRDEKCSNYIAFQYKTINRETTLKICGKEDTNGNILIRTKFFWIKYHVESGIKSQMSIQYSSIFKDSQCKEIFTGHSGTIRTPGFPRTYPANIRCEWKIKNTRKRRLRLHFNFFELESQSSCKYDLLDIRSTNIYNRHTKHVGTFCGTSVVQYVRIDPGKEVTLSFKSDSTIQRQGFHAEFQTV